jgi:cytochrome c-L
MNMQTYPMKIFIGLMVFIMAVVLDLNTANAAETTFTDTKNNQPLKISPALFDTEQSKKFLATGQNPYIGDQAAIASGKKLYQSYSCGQCHGANAGGQTAKGITGPNFNHAKAANDKGMFEIIWAGTNGGMSGKGKGVMDPTDPKNGMSPDEVLKLIAWVRSQGK